MHVRRCCCHQRTKFTPLSIRWFCQCWRIVYTWSFPDGFRRCSCLGSLYNGSLSTDAYRWRNYLYMHNICTNSSSGFLCLYIYARVCVYICAQYICTLIAQIYVPTYMHVCMPICMHHIYAHGWVCIPPVTTASRAHLHAYIYACAYAYIYEYVHTYMYVQYICTLWHIYLSLYCVFYVYVHLFLFLL